MVSLPNDLLCAIIEKADVPIDTYLAFRDIGVRPGKLHVVHEFAKKLDSMIMRRKNGYDKFLRIHKATDGFAFLNNMDRVLKRATLDKTVELNVYEKEGVLCYTFTFVNIPSAPTMRIGIRTTSVYDMFTGKETDYLA